jgi:F-box and WD-40 domain protein 1/11
MSSNNTLPSLHHNARPIARHPPPPPPPVSAPPLLQNPPSVQHVEHPIHATITPQTTMSYTRMIDTCVPQGPAALQNALTSYPTMLAYHSHIQAAIDQESNPMTRSQLRQVVAAALQRAQAAQARVPIQQPMAAASSAVESSTSQTSSAVAQVESQSAAHPLTVQRHTIPQPQRPVGASRVSNRSVSRGFGQASSAAAAPTAAPAIPNMPMVSGGPPAIANSVLQRAQSIQQSPQQIQTQPQPLPQTPAQPTNTTAPVPPAPAHVHHPHITPADAQQPRVFKLQFDAHRIICCSQTPIMVGWDFCNGDPELEEVARFFAPVE